jgi:hypothetical protein
MEEAIEDGDALRLGDWACDGPEAFTALVEAVTVRWPEWPRLKIFTGRRGRLARLSHEAIARLIGKEKAATI